MTEEVKFISEDYQYVPLYSVSGWVKVELVTGRTFVDGQSDREMVYHKHSFRDSVTGDYQTMFYLPYGLAAVP